MIRFGNFTTKAGRESPYFVNSGHIFQGSDLADLSNIYAKHLIQHVDCKDLHLFGPAYKGIPLVTVTALGCAQAGEAKVTATYNRKEAKDHGEGGSLVGYPFQKGDRVVIVEDVISRGTSVQESLEALKSLDVQVEGLIVGVDRMEKGFGEQLASKEVSEKYGITCHAIVTIRDVISYLISKEAPKEFQLNAEMIERVDAYLEKWSI